MNRAESEDSGLASQAESVQADKYGYREELEERVAQLERKLWRTRLLCLLLVLVFLGGIGLVLSMSVLSQRNSMQARLQALRAQQMVQRARAAANQQQAQRALAEALEMPGSDPQPDQEANAKDSSAEK